MFIHDEFFYPCSSAVALYAKTRVGDPPNIMIGSAAPFTFNDFIFHIAPIVVVAWFVTLFCLKIVFRKELAIPPSNVDELMNMNEWDAMKDWKTC